MNRKVTNARVTTLDGITFKSQLEARVYKFLKEKGYDFDYQPEKIILLEGFYPKVPFYKEGKGVTKEDSTKVRGITYTPDFIVYINGITIYVETKGFKTDSYNIKVKLFRKWLNNQLGSNAFVEVKSIRALEAILNQIQ